MVPIFSTFSCNLNKILNWSHTYNDVILIGHDPRTNHNSSFNESCGYETFQVHFQSLSYYPFPQFSCNSDRINIFSGGKNQTEFLWPNCSKRSIKCLLCFRLWCKLHNYNEICLQKLRWDWAMFNEHSLIRRKIVGKPSFWSLNCRHTPYTCFGIFLIHFAVRSP